MKKKSNEKLFIMIILIVVVVIITIYLIVSSGSRIKILSADTDIKRGTVLNEDNVSEYVTTKSVSKDEIEEGSAYTDVSELYNMTVNRNIEKGSVLRKIDCVPYVDPSSGMSEPVVAGLKANEAAQFISGKVTKGDRVNISVTNTVTGECEILLENAYVCGAFNSDGTEADEEGCAMMINILIEKSAEKTFYEKLHTGTLRISRIGSDYDE